MHRFTAADEVIPPYGCVLENLCLSRERPGEGTRPYGATQINQTFYPTCTICRALLCAETEREANPKRRKKVFDDNAVLIAVPAY